MKKVLVAVAALGLVFGVAGNVLALDVPARVSEGEPDTAPRVPQPTAPGVALWSVSGQWVLGGAVIGNANGSQRAELYTESGTDAFYIHSFKILPVLQVNDKIAIKGEIRFADRDYYGDSDLSEGRVIDTHKVYMEWMSPLGKTRFGRTPGGGWGSKFGDNSGQKNRLMLWGNWMPENMGMLVFIQKSTEDDAFLPASDQDVDHYYIDVSHKGDAGSTVAALLFGRAGGDSTDGTPGSTTNDSYVSSLLWIHGKYTFGDFSLETELEATFGEHNDTVDQGAFGLYADLGYHTGDFTFGGKFFYASGDDNPTDGDQESYMANNNGMGNDFNPTQIMTGDYVGLLNADKAAGGGQRHPALRNSGYGGNDVGAMMIQGYASFKATPKLSINGQISYFSAVDEGTGWDDEMGLEVGVGFSYKLYDNLSYNAHAAFLSTGDFWQGDDSSQNIEDIYLLAHSLSMKF
jgi:hypothetical protein